MVVELREYGLLEGHAFASEGRRTFVGLTVHGRLEGKPESRLQSSPAEGLTVTKTEADHRGEAGAVPPPHPLWQGGLQAFGGVPRACGRGAFAGAAPVIWCHTGSRVVRRQKNDVGATPPPRSCEKHCYFF